MLNKKEIIAISVTTLILGFLMSLLETINLFLYSLLTVFLVIILNTLAKKISAFYLDSEIEVEMWEIERYGFKPSRYFKRPFPAGAFLPIITTVFSFGLITWTASLIFDVKTKIHKAAKRHGLYTFSEMTESHLGLIAAAGIFTNLLFSVIGYLINFPEFARINIYYAFFNMIPISNLDGNKIFFGNKTIWSFLASVILLLLIGSLLVV